MNVLNKLLFYVSYLFLYLNNNVSCTCDVENAKYSFTTIATGQGILFESPQWSSQENALYWVDGIAQTIYRWDAETGEITSRSFNYGFIGFLIPVQDYPGILLIAVRTQLFLYDWASPEGDSSLRPLTGVDFGKPDNVIDDGKADADGNVWFGTMGAIQETLNGTPVLDAATLYLINYYNFRNPEVKKRPVSISNGITWSNDNRRMYYNDSPTRKVVKFDFDLEKSEIANMTTLFDFDDYNLGGLPDGMTIDADDNLYVATFDLAKILIINSNTGELLDTIELPVDSVTSMIWGGKDYTTLFVTTASAGVANPQPLSGSVFIFNNLGVTGKPEYLFKFPNADVY